MIFGEGGPDLLQINANFASKTEREKSNPMGMRKVEAQTLTPTAGRQRGFALGVAAEYQMAGGRPQIASQQSPKDASTGKIARFCFGA